MKKLQTVIIAVIMTTFISAQNKDLAYTLSQLPLHCISQEWPNKTSHMSDAADDHRLLPSELHPAFFGCLDWHSSVHGHWLLVRVLRLHPDISNSDSIEQCLNTSLSRDKMEAEAVYFSKYTGSKTFERTYGWAWLLKLDEELIKLNSPKANAWHRNLKPLTDTIVKLWTNYLPKQTYANRTGVHPNTAFGLAFALDWARTTGNKTFEEAIIAKARIFYLPNKDIPAHLEPDASDFFSPSLLAADLMRRILPQKEFTQWISGYFTKAGLANLTTPPVVSDRKDFQTVHLDGLSFSRAWCMKGITGALPAKHPLKKKFEQTATRFIEDTMPLIADNYGGSHWLASFALYAAE